MPRVLIFDWVGVATRLTFFDWVGVGTRLNFDCGALFFEFDLIAGTFFLPTNVFGL